MAKVSLKKLETAFRRWRNNKRYKSEPVPADLAERVRRAAVVHGIAEVSRVSGTIGRKLAGVGTRRKRINKRRRTSRIPGFSKVQLRTPSRPLLPPSTVAEIETAHGLKLRVFSSTPEAMDLVRALLNSEEGGKS